MQIKEKRLEIHILDLCNATTSENGVKGELQSLKCGIFWMKSVRSRHIYGFDNFTHNQVLHENARWSNAPYVDCHVLEIPTQSTVSVCIRHSLSVYWIIYRPMAIQISYVVLVLTWHLSLVRTGNLPYVFSSLLADIDW